MFKRRLGSPPHPGCQSSPGWHEPFLGSGIPTETFLCHCRSNTCESKVLLLGMVIPPLVRKSLLIFNRELLINWVYINVYGIGLIFPSHPKNQRSHLPLTHTPDPEPNSFWINFFLRGGERGSLGVSSQGYVGKIIEKNNGTIMEVDELHGTHTVDGWNRAPVGKYFIPSSTRFCTSQVVVWEFSHQQYGPQTGIASDAQVPN